MEVGETGVPFYDIILGKRVRFGDMGGRFHGFDTLLRPGGRRWRKRGFLTDWLVKSRLVPQKPPGSPTRDEYQQRYHQPQRTQPCVRNGLSLPSRVTQARNPLFAGQTVCRIPGQMTFQYLEPAQQVQGPLQLVIFLAATSYAILVEFRFFFAALGLGGIGSG